MRQISKWLTLLVLIGFAGYGALQAFIQWRVNNQLKVDTTHQADVGEQLEYYSPERLARGRYLVAQETPLLLARFSSKIFGNVASADAARHMFAELPEAVEDVRRKTTIEEIAPRSWLVRLPIVNSVMLETDEGLVIIDTGYASAGPVLKEIAADISDKPIHTIIYTHAHVDHAYGTHPLVEEGMPTQIIAQEKFLPRVERYIAMRGSIAKNMSQPENELPQSVDDLVMPTRYFEDRLELEIGSERFILQHHKGETDDQLYVWAVDRKVLATADFYQGFIPNLGNGKRVQRYIEAWIGAMHEMANLEAEYVLPAHGVALIGREEIRNEFRLHAEAMQHIVDEVYEGLNAGLRPDQVVQSISWPDKYANHPTLQQVYVTPNNIAEMLLKQKTGWWNDIPSDWSPAPLEAQAAQLVDLAGGMETFLSHTRELAKSEGALARHMIDWALLAEPDNREVLELTIQIYRPFVSAKNVPTQEALAYFDHIAIARAKLDEMKTAD